jgi:hypothetical protein
MKTYEIDSVWFEYVTKPDGTRVPEVCIIANTESGATVAIAIPVPSDAAGNALVDMIGGAIEDSITDDLNDDTPPDDAPELDDAPRVYCPKCGNELGPDETECSFCVEE